MHGKDSMNDKQRDSSSVDALAMLIEYALLESRELRLPLVAFLLKMARNAIQAELAPGSSNSPINLPPEELEETF